MTLRSTAFAAASVLALFAVAPAVAAPRCDDRAGVSRHTDRDGHDHAMGPEHAGHGHGEVTRDHKGYALKPRCDDTRPQPARAPSVRSERP